MSSFLCCLSLILFFFFISNDSLHAPIHPQSRIVNGIPTTTSDWPWVVSLRLERWSDGGSSSYHFCGGSIIRRTKPAAILTAAHCIDWLDGYRNYLKSGQWSIWIDINRDDVSPENYTDHSWDQHRLHDYVYHPNVTYDSYDGNTVVHDIGIVFLNEELPITQRVVPLSANSVSNGMKTIVKYYYTNIEHVMMCMDDVHDVQSINESITYSLTIGYGWDSWHSQTLTETLEQTTLEIVEDTACNTAISTYMTQSWTPANYSSFLDALDIDTQENPPNIIRCHECIICAMGNNTDSCNGDSGSPLITGTNLFNAIQIGVVSYGFECNANYEHHSGSSINVPAQYTDITFYLKWIQSTLQRSLEPPQDDTSDVVISTGNNESEYEEEDDVILDMTTLGTGICLGAAMIFFCLSMIIMFMRRSSKKLRSGYDRTTAQEIEVINNQ